MKQVPNPLPKVLSRRGIGAGMEAAERESFERTQVRTGNLGASLGHAKRCSCWRDLEGNWRGGGLVGLGGGLGKVVRSESSCGMELAGSHGGPGPRHLYWPGDQGAPQGPAERCG